MALVDFMDESSEMYMEAREQGAQNDRMTRKMEKGVTDNPRSPKELNYTAKRISSATDDYNKLYQHDLKYNKKAANDTRRAFNGDDEAGDRSLSRAAYALDAMDRNRRRHKHEGAIELI